MAQYNCATGTRSVLAVPPRFSLFCSERFHQLHLFGFIDYPMITEEAGFPLSQKSPHHAHPQLSPGT